MSVHCDDGRLLSADRSAVPAPVPYANLTNPQTLNLYAMVADDPESFADLDGHDLDPNCGLTNCKEDPGNKNANETQANAAAAEPKTAEKQQEDKKKKKDDQGDEDKNGQKQQNPPTQASGGKGGGQGSQGKGERHWAGKPPRYKGLRRLPDGRWQYKDPQTGKTVTKPADWSPTTRSIIEGVAAGGLAVGTGYIIYRAVRMLPSLLPPLWWTIPANATVP